MSLYIVIVYLLSVVKLLHPWFHITVVADGVAEVLSLATFRQRAEVVQVSIDRLQLENQQLNFKDWL